MRYYSTNNKTEFTSFRNAVINGLAPDGGLYMPENIPSLQVEFLNNLGNFSFKEIAFEIAQKFVGDEIEKGDLKSLVEDAINFEAPIHSLNEKLHILELFHGPTLAFKDFGARFMSRMLGHFVKDENKEVNILVATSGDTGSAVASGFYDTPGINVYILYPAGKVSEIQEKQLTTLGKNITALEINGTFDDCQKLVKDAFVDNELNSHLKLSSANSINIARLIPQSFYYFESYKQLPNNSKPALYCVPSGNLGNITAGLLAKEMGLPIKKFIAATNANSVFTEFIETGVFNPRKSISTYSNAMDVGNPSNLARIIDLYKHDQSIIAENIGSNSHSDEHTIKGIEKVYNDYNYVIDPHGAVGVMAVNKFISESKIDDYNAVVLETAHPAKFKHIVETTINRDIEIPARLAECLNKEKKSTLLSNDYREFKGYLLTR